MVVGQFLRAIYEEAFCQSFERLGHTVKRFSWLPYFKRGFFFRVQYRLQAGPLLQFINRDLCRAAGEFCPDLILIWRGTVISATTVAALKHTSGVRAVISYNNDNPFGGWRDDPYWQGFIRAIPAYTAHFVYRQSNILDYQKAGAGSVYLLRAYYDPQLHYPRELSPTQRAKYQCEAAFIGHYDPGDQREVYLEAVARAGLHIRVYGEKSRNLNVFDRMAKQFIKVGEGGWDVEHLRQGGIEFMSPVEGEDYPLALSGTDIALNFLSTSNRYTYTRRCFEIPACGRVMLSARTEDLYHLFQEDREAMFFSSPAEIADKAQWLKNHPEAREKIAARGRERCLRDGHDIDSRAKQMLAQTAEL